ncbi:hypothetical protein SOVF_011900, partial [Spinacia oleracea]
MISRRVKHDNESGSGHGIILDRIESPPELQQYREDILHQPLLQQQPPQQQPPPPPPQQQKPPPPPPAQQQRHLQQQPQQQQQQQQRPLPRFLNDGAHQSSPVAELDEDQEIPQQQAHSNTNEEVKIPSTFE